MAGLFASGVSASEVSAECHEQERRNAHDPSSLSILEHRTAALCPRRDVCVETADEDVPTRQALARAVARKRQKKNEII